MASIKQNYITGNQSPFMNKDIHKTQTTRTRLRNRFIKEATPINRLGYDKQWDYYLSLMPENKKQYGSLNVNHIMGNEDFWRVVKPILSNKIVATNRVIIRDSGEIKSDAKRLLISSISFFVNIGNTFKLTKLNDA